MTPTEYRPPSKRRLQIEAWGIVLTLLIAGWGFVGGLYLTFRLLLTLVERLLGG